MTNKEEKPNMGEKEKKDYVQPIDADEETLKRARRTQHTRSQHPCFC
ncbi:hypothetical protein KKH36_02435 [Patescibacteria group bacterium]|nr:hypothetical protein [Patescibacteria group bacterium]